MRQPQNHEVDIQKVEEGHLLADLEIHTDHDTMLARQRMRQVSRLLGFRNQAQTQIATAGSEIVRNALNHAGSNRVRVYLGDRGRTQLLWIMVQDNGPGISEEMARQGSGITSARHLMDLFQISSTPGQGTTILMGKRLRKPPLSAEDLLSVMEKVAQIEPRSTLKETQDQNRELMATLDALRRAKERESLRAREWQTTFDAIPDALCLLDDTCNVLRVNHAMVALLGRPEADLVGKPWRQLSPLISQGDPDEDVLKRTRMSRCRTAEDQKLHNRWYRIQADALLDEANNVHRFVLLIVDITEEKRSTERLTQINDALKNYAHSISHDIKGPLAGAVTANQVLQQLLAQPITNKSTTSIQELGEVLSTCINKALSLINEVLALAETGAGPGGSTYIRRVIDRVLEDRQTLIKDNHVKVELDSSLGQAVAAPAHLYQVFANLVDNSIKHGKGSDCKGSDLTINIRRLASPEEGVHRFLFRDNGPGIPEVLQGRLFDPFVRGNLDCEGRGIGLATVKRVVATYNGEVRAYNDHGACIELVIRDAVA